MDGLEGLFNWVDDQAVGIGSALSTAAGGTDPGTLARASQGQSLLSAGLSAVGDIASRLGKAQQYGYAQQAAEQNAASALAAGQVNEEAEKIKTGQLASEQVAAEASSGLDVSSGSFQNVNRSTKMLGALDAAMIHYNAQREAYGYNAQAAGFKLAKTNQLIGAVGDVSKSLLTGANALRGNATLFAKMGVNQTPAAPVAPYDMSSVDWSLPRVGSGGDW